MMISVLDPKRRSVIKMTFEEGVVSDVSIYCQSKGLSDLTFFNCFKIEITFIMESDFFSSHANIISDGSTEGARMRPLGPKSSIYIIGWSTHIGS